MRNPFTEVSDILRAQLRDGYAAPGSLLVVTDIARTLQISPTPVREALGQLAGEGLIEVQRGRGARVRPLDAAEIADLYRLHALYLVSPLDDQPDAQSPQNLQSLVPRCAADLRRDWTSIRQETEALFGDLIGRSGARVMQQALMFAANRLAVVRLAEGEVFDDLFDEIGALRERALVHDPARLNAALGAYHRRRQAAASTLASTVRDIFRV